MDLSRSYYSMRYIMSARRVAKEKSLRKGEAFSISWTRLVVSEPYVDQTSFVRLNEGLA